MKEPGRCRVGGKWSCVCDKEKPYPGYTAAVSTPPGHLRTQEALISCVILFGQATCHGVCSLFVCHGMGCQIKLCTSYAITDYMTIGIWHNRTKKNSIVT